ncbi:MAG: hypothetical protein WCI37_02265 [bacterium]|jgi:hypothetical protein
MNTTTTKGSPYLLILFIVIFGGVIIYFIYSSIKRKEEVFEGVIIDKNVIENQTANNTGSPTNNGIGLNIGNNLGGVTHTYKIRVKDDSGKEFNYKVSEGQYEILKIGDRVSKAKGTTVVTVISSSQVQSPKSGYSLNLNNQEPISVPPIPPIPLVTPINPNPPANPQTPSQSAETNTPNQLPPNS